MLNSKKIKETKLFFKENCEHAFGLALSAVEKAGFSNIESSKSELKIVANYHKLTVWGKIEVHFMNADGGSFAIISVSAKKDNIYALAQDPSEKILLAFKEQIPATSQALENDSDIPSQIKKLSDLKDSGILTAKEFTSKKAELLSRM